MNEERKVDAGHVKRKLSRRRAERTNKFMIDRVKRLGSINNTERVKYKNDKITNKRELGLILIGVKEANERIHFSNEVMFEYTLFTELQDDGKVHIYGMKNEVMFCPMCGRRI